MKTLVLTAIEQPAGNEAPLELFEWVGGTRRSLARAMEPVSASRTFQYAGANVDLLELLTQAKLVEKQRLEAAGDHLYARLLLGDVGVALQQVGKDSRVMLDLRGRTLEVLPWELLRRGKQMAFALPVNPWCRGTPEPRPVQPPLELAPAQPPPRILIVVGSARGDDSALGDHELRAIEDGLHAANSRILVEALVREHPATIRKAIEDLQPNVVHFIGHSSIVDDEPVLHLVAPKDPKASGGELKTYFLDRDFLRGLFTEACLPRLVVLSACNTAHPVPSWDLARLFEDAGVLATLTMQAPVRGDAAVEFSRKFYEQLARGNAVDVAAAAARRTVADEIGDHDLRMNWPIPRLVVHADPGTVVLWPAGGAPLSIRADDDFVGRWQQRRQVWDTLRARDGARGSRLAVVTGAAESGKTAFLKLLGEMWTRVNGHTAIYIDLDHRDHTSSFGLLLDRLGAALVAARRSRAAIDALDRALPVTTLAEKLRGVLDTVIGDQLLLLIDGLHSWEKNVVGQIVNELCTPFAAPDSDAPGARLVVSLVPEHADAVNWRDDFGLTPIIVGEFTRNEWMRAGAQFIRVRAEKFEDANRRADFNQGAWGMLWLKEPDELTTLNQTFGAGYLGVVRDWARRLAGGRRG